MPRSTRRITTPAVVVRASFDEECTAESLGTLDGTLKIIARTKRPMATITTTVAEDAVEEVDEDAPTLADHGGKTPGGVEKWRREAQDRWSVDG